MSTPKRVFIGFSQTDAAHLETLKKHLKLYERQNLIQIWDESMMIPGEVRKTKIEQEINTAEIILLLFSVDLLAEDFIWGAEITKILEKVKRREVQLIPILLGPSSFADTHFSAYAAVPQRDKPISNYNNKDEAWTIVVEQIKRSIQAKANPQLINEPNLDKMTIEQLKTKVRELIAKNRPQEAINEIRKWALENNDRPLMDETVLVESTLTKLEKEVRLGTVYPQDAGIRQSQINSSILDLPDQASVPRLSPDTPPVGPEPPSSGKLKILMMTANPARTTQLNLGKEQLKIMEKLGDKKDQFELIVKKAIDKEDFKQYTEIEKPQILHFSGHGEPGENGGILVQNEDRNGSALIPPSGVKTLFKYFTSEEIGIQAVVLNACYSEEQAEIIAQYVPYVIGTRVNIGDNLAIDFSTGFYFRLAEKGIDFVKAFNSGVAQASLNGAQEEHFVLYKNGTKIEA